MTCCHPAARRHSPQMRPDRSRWQKDAGKAGRRGQEKPLYVERARKKYNITHCSLLKNFEDSAVSFLHLFHFCSIFCNY